MCRRFWSRVRQRIGSQRSKTWLVAESMCVPRQVLFESLTELNERFADQGLPPVLLEPAPDHFETGDVLELVSAGVVDYAVSDDYLAEFWSRVLPELDVHEDVVLRDGADIAFAVRPDNGGLKAALDEFLQTHRSGTLFRQCRLRAVSSGYEMGHG